MAFKTQLFWIIDIMNTLNKSKTGAHTPLKRLVYLLTLCGFTTSSLAGTFPTTPLHLQDETKTTTAAGVKPNIMLFIDDSGSMDEAAGNSTRIKVTKNALTKVLDTYKNDVNWGLQTLWNNGNANYIANNGFTDQYSTIKTHVENLKAGSGTPTTARYFQVQNIVRDNIKNRCQKSYIVLMSDGDANLSCYSNNYQLSNFSTSNYVGTNDKVSSGYRLKEKTWITKEHTTIFGTKLDQSNVCTSGGSVHPFWDVNTGLEWFSEPLYNKDLMTTASYPNGDAYQVSWDDPKYPKQNIVTYTVGFGSGISNAGRQYLVKGASPCSGGTCPSYEYTIGKIKYSGSDKHYYNAINADDLVKAFEQIFKSIDSENKTDGQKVHSATAPAISSNYVDGLAAAATLNTGSWSSEILFYNINSQGKLDTANPMRASFNNRKVLISDSVNVHLYSNKLTADTISKNNLWYNIPNVNNTSSNPNKLEWSDGLLKWMARADTDKNIQAQKTGIGQFQLDYRERPLADAANNITDQRSMGDIIDNSILAIGEMENKRQEFVVTATNDGMVYVFQSQNSKTNPYDLKFNYAPAKMERNSNDGTDYVGKYYKDSTRTGYGQDSETNPHSYLLNGGMVARSTDKGGNGKQFFLASTMGQAGRGAFAINIGGVNRTTGAAIAANNIDATNWQNDVKLFETVSGSANQLGFTIGTPQVGRVQVDTRSVATNHDTGANIHYGVFVSNGYNYKTNYSDSTSKYADTPALYVYEGLGQDVGLTPTSGGYTKGTVLQKISVSGGSGGLATPTLVDVNFDGVIDYAYAGDFGGGLYRFNLLSPNPNHWTATKIFQTADNKPITSAPAVFRNSADKYTVVVGTGSEIYQEDLASKTQQALYGIFDDLTLTDNSALVMPSDLLGQTLSSESLSTSGGGMVTVRKVTNKPLDAARHKGWSVALDGNTGERITVKPSIMGNSVLLTTRVYEQEVISNTGDDPCLDQTQRASSSAYSWLMQFNLANGGLITYNANSVYIDFNLGDASKFKLSGNNQQYMLTGQKLNSLTSITLIDSLMAGFSASTSGDSGGSGEDTVLNPNAKIPKNTCVGDDSKAFTFNTVGESETYDIYGTCRDDSKAAYQRLSWREIF